MMLAGSPLPWPSAETAAKVRLPPYHGGVPPQVISVRDHSLNLTIAAAIIGPQAGGSSIGQSITRMALIDRRFNVEPELPAFIEMVPCSRVFVPKR